MVLSDIVYGRAQAWRLGADADLTTDKEKRFLSAKLGLELVTAVLPICASLRPMRLRRWRGRPGRPGTTRFTRSA